MFKGKILCNKLLTFATPTFIVVEGSLIPNKGVGMTPS